ncbi:NPCBM/NEW2 domain-containing protein [Amycolatopsis eburnea]|uniref:Glycosyl hydrolase family 98 putative carbohydrate-binding module domain-containing protein n=1 Tax=Amycolatopsis eburnea TaxID=2267691 RepID=A0A3R9DRY4_9PSEU|nr:NPCBM/NEW2 domain-containing protein [Amycolatopsis eburnea]RSD10586.1 hypothetical protein EIY87_37775 [Amycolatopsis eburnea]
MIEVLRAVGNSQSALLGIFGLGVALLVFAVTGGRVIVRHFIRVDAKAGALTKFAVRTIGALGVLCIGVAFFASPAPAVIASWFPAGGSSGTATTLTPDGGRPAPDTPSQPPETSGQPTNAQQPERPPSTTRPQPIEESTPAVAADPPSGYLSQMKAVKTVGADGTEELMTANGHDYLHSVYASQNYCLSSSRVSYVDYSLERKYATFTATAALKDTDRPDLKVRYEVFADNSSSPRYSTDIAYGEQASVSVPVKGVLRLRLSATFFTPKDCNEFDRAIWGDAHVG